MPRPLREPDDHDRRRRWGRQQTRVHRALTLEGWACTKPERLLGPLGPRVVRPGALRLSDVCRPRRRGRSGSTAVDGARRDEAACGPSLEGAGVLTARGWPGPPRLGRPTSPRAARSRARCPWSRHAPRRAPPSARRSSTSASTGSRIVHRSKLTPSPRSRSSSRTRAHRAASLGARRAGRRNRARDDHDRGAGERQHPAGSPSDRSGDGPAWTRTRIGRIMSPRL